ncbi:MAG: hypothetical protein WBZ48_11390 [Bacteroidota bacterium]
MDQQSAIEEIALIKRVIDESRRFTFDRGKYYLMWGILVAAAIFIDYSKLFLNTTGLSGWWLWIATIGIGWIISIIFAIREHSRVENWPIGAKLAALVWVSLGITSIILGFAGSLSGALQLWAVCPAIAAVMGAAYMISSLIYSLKWMALLGTGWWIGALCMFAVQGISTLPIFGTLMILFQTIPGIVCIRLSMKALRTGDAQ